MEPFDIIGDEAVSLQPRFGWKPSQAEVIADMALQLSLWKVLSEISSILSKSL